MIRLFFIHALLATFCLPVLLPVKTGACQASGDTGLSNGSFAQWENGLPVGWNVGNGATNSAGKPVSVVSQGPDHSLELSGDSETGTWRFVSQTLNVQRGQSLRVNFSAKAVGIQREGNQFDNCYVGLMPKKADGAKLPLQIWTVSQESFQDFSQIVRVPDLATTIDVMIFLSKTGTLSVRQIEFEMLKPEDSFDILVADMARNYSFLEQKQINWPTVAGKYRERALAAKTPKEFSAVAAEMLGELRDLHTWIICEGNQIPGFRSGTDPNYDMASVDKALGSTKRFGKLGSIGETPDGFVYIRIDSLSGITNDEASALIAEIENNSRGPGCIVDLRRNGGGAEGIAAAIAGRFTNQEVIYARQKFRSGERPSDFVESAPRVLQPSGKDPFTGPIACLIGPGTVSSGEGMAMMMKALPHCTLVGQPTRGASGNPAPVQLPNGVDIWYSRWVSMLPDGTPIDGTGVPPDVKVDHTTGKDATFLQAIEILREKTK